MRTSDGRELIRTCDERFANLPGFPFQPNYIEVNGLRMHYIDEGPRDADPVMMMHGEPDWSYLYRKMIPIVVAAGHRVIAADMIGFGRSDKLTNRDDYTYQMHVDQMIAFVEQMGLTRITLMCQDWGGLIGLRVVAAHPELFARVVAANTAMPTIPLISSATYPGPDPNVDLPPDTDFFQWHRYSQTSPDFPIGYVMEFATVTELPAEVEAAYDAPFPNETYKAGARQFPTLVDKAVLENAAAWNVLRQFDKPFLTAFSDGDGILGPWNFQIQMQNEIPGAQGQPHTTIRGAGHMLQEDKGEELAQVLVSFIAATP